MTDEHQIAPRSMVEIASLHRARIAELETELMRLRVSIQLKNHDIKLALDSLQIDSDEDKAAAEAANIPFHKVERFQ